MAGEVVSVEEVVVSVEEVLHVAEDHHGVDVVVLEAGVAEHRMSDIVLLLTLHMLWCLFKGLGINLSISCYSTFFRNTSVCTVD